jgi:hypothetical protein
LVKHCFVVAPIEICADTFYGTSFILLKTRVKQICAEILNTRIGRLPYSIRVHVISIDIIEELLQPAQVEIGPAPKHSQRHAERPPVIPVLAGNLLIRALERYSPLSSTTSYRAVLVVSAVTAKKLQEYCIILVTTLGPFGGGEFRGSVIPFLSRSILSIL